MMEGCRKEDPPTKKQLPVGIEVPEFLAELGMVKGTTEMVKTDGDCAIIAFCYLLQVEEYKVKNTMTRRSSDLVQSHPKYSKKTYYHDWHK